MVILIFLIIKEILKRLNPEIRVYDKPETLTFETAINTNLKHDLYLTMSNLEVLIFLM